MKITYSVIAYLVVFNLNSLAVSAPICGSWNNYENCINPPEPANKIDQGTIAKQHYDSFINHVEPNFTKYREEHQKNNAAIQENINDELNKINDYFIRYAKGIHAWKLHSPGSFYDYFRTNDESKVLRDQWNKFDYIVTDIYEEIYNNYFDIYLKLNPKVVERIEYHYYGKAYAPTISGIWGFQPQYNYGYMYHPLDGVSFIHEGGNNRSFTALTFSDKWNNANTQPTTRTNQREVYVEVSLPDMNNKLNILANTFLNGHFEDTTDYITELAYVMEFESKLLQLLTLDSLGDINTKKLSYSLSYVDHISKEDILKDVFYTTKNYAESNAISLVYAYAVNRKDQDYLSRLQTQLEKVKQLPWYEEANELYKNIIDGILENSDIPIKIALDYQYINYIIDNNKMEVRGWEGMINKGSMRSYINPYASDELEIMKAKKTDNFVESYGYFPNHQQSNNNWEFVGVMFDINQYRNFISSIEYSEWGENTFPGDIHKSNGMYFTPKFNGNPLNNNRTYPTEPHSDDNWFYIGNDDKMDDGLYSYVIYTRFYHDLYSQMVKLWLLNIQNGNANYIDIDLPYKQIGQVNKTLATLLSSSQKEWRYAGYALLDSSLILNLEHEIIARENLGLEFFRLYMENVNRIMELPGIDDIPDYAEVFQRWSDGEWGPPDEFTDSWYPRALPVFNNDAEELKLYIKNVFDDGINPDLGALVTSFSNVNLIGLINAMAVTSNLTISITTLTTVSALASLFGIL